MIPFTQHMSFILSKYEYAVQGSCLYSISESFHVAVWATIGQQLIINFIMDYNIDLSVDYFLCKLLCYLDFKMLGNCEKSHISRA